MGLYCIELGQLAVSTATALAVIGMGYKTIHESKAFSLTYDVSSKQRHA